ncbi:CBS domain-containing protein [Pyrodictium delaneyi]|uniref:CBS domain-containing protein n=2 Tax=Pyrodictium delaneyi TaxID=1273541 RepID=A0A211YRQ2_9CREN|nr:CBS domain-containing protein [Pyrodictium delaneyi]OWJ55651.1 hypothetical protein Pdsh_02385 [Pyrodictium delaneyi]
MVRGCYDMMKYPRVDEYMSTPVVVVRPDDSLARARRLMIRYRIGRLVVIDDQERPIGIITKADFVRLASGQLTRRPLDAIIVKEVMTENPVVIRSDRSLREAARLMLQHKVGGLPVVDESGKLVGMITKTDVVRAYAEKLRGKYKVKDYMYVDAPQASLNHSVAYVVELLETHPARRVLVVDGGELVGIIAPSDIAFVNVIPRVVKGKSKISRRFFELPKGRIGPVYEYMLPTAQDIMTPDPVTIEAEEDLAAAAQLMIRHGFSSLPVMVEDSPVGVVVKHNILRAISES